jgi:energy-coupling factor transporter ATP-binding protein EcfA2
MIHQFKAEGIEANLNFDINLEPNKRVYCFIGENGCGKTQLLENMAKTLLFSSSIFMNQDKTLKFQYLYWYNQVLPKIKELTFTIPQTIEINNFSLRKDNPWQFVPFKDVILRGEVPIFDYPFIFISPKNRGYTKNIDRNNVKFIGNREERFVDAITKTYKGFQKETVEDTFLSDWLSSRLFLDSVFIEQSETRKYEVDTILQLMKLLDPKLMKVLHEKENLLKNFSFKDGKTHFLDVPIEHLSTGYISIIKIFQEIIAGYGGWIGMIGEADIHNTKGVVFIDAIESHLHAKWQYKIIPLLKEFFPKTTFYIATHSPLIVSTTNQDEAYELIREGENVTAKKLGNPKNWYLADVYAQAFHVDFTDEAFIDETQAVSLPEMLKLFSEQVKDYTVHPIDTQKNKIHELYQKILPNLGEDDPRKRSLDSLYSLVK